VREYHVLNLGAGVQSTALFLLAREPDPKVRFDLAIFADTGEEPSAVYKHLGYLRSLGNPEIWVATPLPAFLTGNNALSLASATGLRYRSAAG
jgi:hypothetical protein